MPRRNPQPPPAGPRQRATAPGVDAAFVRGFPLTLAPRDRALLEAWAAHTGRTLRYARDGVHVPHIGGAVGRICPPARIDELLTLARRTLTRAAGARAAERRGLFEAQMRAWALGGPAPPWALDGDGFPETVRGQFSTRGVAPAR